MKTTIEELQEMTDDFITASQAASILGCNPQHLRNQAQANHSKLGFKVSVIGTRIYIPRIPFIEYVKGVNKNV